MSVTLGATAAPSTTASEGLGGIDFSNSSDKKSKFVVKIFLVIEKTIRALQYVMVLWELKLAAFSSPCALQGISDNFIQRYGAYIEDKILVANVM